ncbi:Kynurenine formamidase [Borealophlyctis nickersoniae]|nr:Kynurenine formamidase [Borealophlyctis nickersoniae]
MPVHKDIPYAEDTNPKQTLDLYIPDCLPTDPVPLIVYVHGGAWRTGDKSEYEHIGQYFANQHCIPTLIPSYRLSPGVTHPTHLEDVSTAILFSQTPPITSLLKTTPTSIYLVGHSAGGTMCGTLALQPKWLESVWDCVKGVVGVQGIYDLIKLVDVWPSYVDFVEGAFGKREEGDMWRDASPQYMQFEQNKEGRTMPPFMVMHCPNDELVDIQQAERFVEHLREVGSKDVELMTEGLKGSHFGMLKERAFLDAVVKFVKRVG